MNGMEAAGKKKYAAPAVSKLLDILELFAEENRGFTINDLAKRLQEPVNTIYRICKELEERVYLYRDGKDGLYYLGSRFYCIGQIAGGRIDTRTCALPHMEALRDSLNETVHLAVLQSGRMVLLDQKETGQPIRIQVETGALLLPHASAFGKCLLAHAAETELEGYIQAGLASLTANTITDAAALRGELERIRRNGWAFDLEEYMPGARCVGAPVFNRSGVCVAAVGVIAPAYRFSIAEMQKACRPVMDAAAAISTALGRPGERNG